MRGPRAGGASSGGSGGSRRRRGGHGVLQVWRKRPLSVKLHIAPSSEPSLYKCKGWGHARRSAPAKAAKVTVDKKGRTRGVTPRAKARIGAGEEKDTERIGEKESGQD